MSIASGNLLNVTLDRLVRKTQVLCNGFVVVVVVVVVVAVVVVVVVVCVCVSVCVLLLLLLLLCVCICCLLYTSDAADER